MSDDYAMGEDPPAGEAVYSCMRCLGPVDDEAHLCPHCGARLKAEPPPPPPPPEPPPPPPPEPEAPPPQDPKPEAASEPKVKTPEAKITGAPLAILLLLIASGVVALGFGAWSVLRPRAAPPAVAPPPPKPAPIVEAAPAPAPSAPLAPVAIRSNALITWSAATSGGPVLYRAEGVSVQLDLQRRRVGIRITGPGGQSVTLPASEAAGGARVTFGVGHLDPASRTAQVLLTGGGANRLVELLDGRWRVLDLGEWSGGGFPTLRAADGAAEFEFRDDRFGAMGAGGGRAPPLIKAVRDGRLVDASGDPAARPVFEAAMRRFGPDCEKGDNGACAAYVASAARIGQTDAAWRFMLSHADRRGSAGLPTPCRRPEFSARTCPAADLVAFASFPEALRWFLGETGYLPRSPLPPAEKAAGAASYDCNRAGSFNLGLICNDPRLAAADREMTRLYARALGLQANSSQLRDEQQAFQDRRDNAPPDRDVLLTLYNQRIAQLKARIGP